MRALGLSAETQHVREHPVIDPGVTRRPSRKRVLLAVYIDYLIFTAAYQPVAWALRSVAPASNWFVALAVFAVLRGVASLLNRSSPGTWSLGIRYESHLGMRPRAVLNERLVARSRWWTLAAGTLLVLEGSKNAVRWTQGLPIEPLLGAGTPHGMAAASITLLGLANIVAGALTLRTRVAGAALGIAVLAGEFAATVANREAFERWAADAVVARRGLQGIPVRDGEIEMMQTVATTVLPFAIAMGIGWLSLVAFHFRRSSDGSRAPQPSAQ